MSTLRSADHSVVTLENDRFAITVEKRSDAVVTKKDRSSLCSFTFSDGRRCRTPRSGNHPHFCYFHARKEAQVKASEELGEDISYFFSRGYLTARDLSAALGQLFAAVARGQVKPKTAATLAYLGQTLAQTIPLAQREYFNALGSQAWRQTIYSSVKHNSERKHQAAAQNPDQNPQPGAANNPDASPK